MSTFSSVSDLLEGLSPDLPAAPQWDDVLARAESLAAPTQRSAPSRRAGHPFRPRRTFALAALALLGLVAAVVAAAYALGHPVITFDSAPKAKSRTVVNFFGRMTVGAVPIPVLPHQAREITHVRIDGVNNTLYIAPMKRGGFCWMWIPAAGGCQLRPQAFNVSEITRPTKGPTTGSVAVTEISGAFNDNKAARVELTFADGDRIDIPFVWVTRPINSGFFLYGIQLAHQKAGHEAVRIALLGARGNVITSQPVTGVFKPIERRLAYKLVHHHVAGYPLLHVPSSVVWASRKQLFDLRSDNGTHIGFWVGATRTGGTCYWSNIHAGCFASDPLWPKVLRGHGYVALCCSVVTGTSKVVAYFQDGDKVTLAPKQGYLIWPIPHRHYPPGHRLNRLVTYDANGARTASVKIQTNVRALYPCKKPTNYGYGLVMCP